jgi:hypothetical protein
VVSMVWWDRRSTETAKMIWDFILLTSRVCPQYLD